jgi:hypothetical protein
LLVWAAATSVPDFRRNVTGDPTNEFIYQMLNAFPLDPALGLAAVNFVAVRASCWRQKTQ